MIDTNTYYNIRFINASWRSVKYLVMNCYLQLKSACLFKTVSEAKV
jgi:hypothetical protein